MKERNYNKKTKEKKNIIRIDNPFQQNIYFKRKSLIMHNLTPDRNYNRKCEKYEICNNTKYKDYSSFISQIKKQSLINSKRHSIKPDTTTINPHIYQINNNKGKNVNNGHKRANPHIKKNLLSEIEINHDNDIKTKYKKMIKKKTNENHTLDLTQHILKIELNKNFNDENEKEKKNLSITKNKNKDLKYLSFKKLNETNVMFNNKKKQFCKVTLESLNFHEFQKSHKGLDNLEDSFRIKVNSNSKDKETKNNVYSNVKKTARKSKDKIKKFYTDSKYLFEDYYGFKKRILKKKSYFKTSDKKALIHKSKNRIIHFPKEKNTTNYSKFNFELLDVKNKTSYFPSNDKKRIIKSRSGRQMLSDMLDWNKYEFKMLSTNVSGKNNLDSNSIKNNNPKSINTMINDNINSENIPRTNNLKSSRTITKNSNDRKKFCNRIYNNKNEEILFSFSQEAKINTIPKNIYNKSLFGKNNKKNKIKKNGKENEDINLIERTLLNIRVISQAGQDENNIIKTNQDSYIIQRNVNNVKYFNIFGLFDGHGINGHKISLYLKTNLIQKIIEHKDIKCLNNHQDIYYVLSKKNYQILTDIFIQTDEELLFHNKIDSLFNGSTCIIIIQLGIHIICANCGDSRAIMIFDDEKDITKINNSNINHSKVFPLSYDHSPEKKEEKERINQSGGEIFCTKSKRGNSSDIYRIYLKGRKFPGLSMSRSFGDLACKKIGVIVNPQFIEYSLNKSCKYIVICSDGVWSFLSNEDVMNIGNKYYLSQDPDQFCRELVEQSTQRWLKNSLTIDDITVIAIFFNYL